MVDNLSYDCNILNIQIIINQMPAITHHQVSKERYLINNLISELL